MPNTIKLSDGRELDKLPQNAETAALVVEIGSLDARGYAHPLPALTTVGGYLDASGYAHPLPALTTVGGSLDARGYAHPLPALTTVGGSLDASGYAHPLPALTTVGGYLIKDAPFVKNIHKTVYDAAKADTSFDMGGWGRDTACQTGRCRGGHVVNASGQAGFNLKAKTDWGQAALLIYLRSDPDLWRKGYPNFSSDVKNDDALADMKRYAELEAAGAQ